MKQALIFFWRKILPYSFGIGLLFFWISYPFSKHTHPSSANPNNDYSYYDEENSCDYSNGRHSATIEYYNSSTGYSNTYTLDVEVEDCQVTTIYFNNGGYLDDSHIEAAYIDADGNANVDDDRGRNFDVHIDD